MHRPGPVGFAEVVAARRRLRGVARLTPVLRSSSVDGAVSAQIWMKAEYLQRSGSFKFRGAYNATASLSAAERRAGVCTVSSGNHARALAVAAGDLGVSTLVLMPEDAPARKIEAVRAAGAEVRLFDRYAVSQAELASRLETSGPEVYISAHDHPLVIAGAATAAIETFDQCGSLDALVMAVGGGGGLAGAGIVARQVNPSCRVIGVEPAASGINRRSLQAGRRVEGSVPRTIADGQTLTSPGVLTFEIMRRVVDEVVLTTDTEILAAMRFMRDQCGLVLEPSGAAGIAAVLAGKVAGSRIGVVLSGGNIDAETFDALLAVGSGVRARS